MNAHIKVYLNDGDNLFRKFSPDDARLSLALEFQTPLGDDLDGLTALLEDVYVQLNVGGDVVPATDWCEQYRAAGNRSLSTGDVVVIGEAAFSCDPFGWSFVRTADLVAAISRKEA